MKNLLILIFIGVFSFITFGQEEKPAEQAEAQASKEKPVVKKEAKPAEEKPMVKDEAKASEEKPMVKDEAKASEEKPMVKDEAKASEEKPMAKDEVKPSDKKQTPQQPVVSEEKPAVAAVQESGSAEASAVQVGVKYECDGGRSYTLHEPGANDESHLCELDAGHTEAAVDWYALNQSSFCRQKLQEMIELHSCAVK